MTLDDYQEAAGRTDNEQAPSVMYALGLCGEAGEVADALKKMLHHGHDYSEALDKIQSELGDVLWYVARMAAHFGWDLSAVADRNLGKLRKRYPDGFTEEASRNRGDK